MSTKSPLSFMLGLALLLAACLASGSARANATFQFALSGQLDQQGCGDPSCTIPGEVVFPWTGKLTVVLDTAADGVYDNSDLVSFDLASTCCTFHEPAFTPLPFFASFTVADGRLTAIDAVYYDPEIWDIVTRFGGLSVSYFQPLIFFTPVTTGSAVLTPVPVPEPATWAMLVAALAMAAALRGRRAALRATREARST